MIDTPAASTAAFLHHPDAVSSVAAPVAGRRVAGSGLLRGIVQHGRQDSLTAVAHHDAHLGHFRGLVSRLGWSGPVRTHHISDLSDLEPAALMLPGPSLAETAWARPRAHPWSICGITHTMATPRVSVGILESLVAPVRPWDAIVCTSTAVHRVVEVLVEEAAAYLGDRFGVAEPVRPLLPIVPLGVDVDAWASTAHDRAGARQHLGVEVDEVVAISVARLSVAEKQHPAPLMIAAERAARAAGRQLTFLLVGRFDGHESEGLTRLAAQHLAPSVRVVVVDGEDAVARDRAWAAADLFVLAVDNVQETFGLAPVEAMAAGLPVVVSDWNGFADTVEDGVSGFRVPTHMVAAPATDLAAALATGGMGYLDHLEALSARTVVDVDALAAALTRLIGSPSLRAQMGAAGRRAAARYDWRVVVASLEAVWDEQESRRAAAGDRAADVPGPAHPAFPDPVRLYAHYATERLTPTGTRFRRTADPADLDRVLRVVSGTPHPDPAVLHAILLAVDGSQDGAAIAARTGRTPGESTAAAAWLAKMGLVAMEVG